MQPKNLPREKWIGLKKVDSRRNLCFIQGLNSFCSKKLHKITLPFFFSLIITVIVFNSNHQLRAEAWNFAVISDVQESSGGSGVNTDALAAVAADIVNNRECTFVLIAGDAVNGECSWIADVDQDDLVDQYNTLKEAATDAGLKVAGSSGTGIPYYPVRGNHDTYNSDTGVDTAEVWQEAFPTLPQNGSTTGAEGNSEVGMTYSFTYDNTLFLAIDEYINAPNSWTPTLNQDWVDEQLSSVTSDHIIAFGHTAAYQAYHSDCLALDQTARDDFLTSLYNAGGRLYFAGHDHFVALGRVYEKDPDSGGTQGFYQVIDGSSGGGLRTFDGGYNDNYPLDYSVADLYHSGDPTTYYAYALVTVDDDLLWLRMYGTESLTTVDWQLLHSLVIGGALTGDTSTLTGNITNDAVITFNQTSDGTYSSVISGLGNLTKGGSAALTLSGTNTYTGTTSVNAGTLNVTGSCSNSAVTVNSGGILTGAGTIKSLTNHGTIRPGNSVGTLNLNGDAFIQGSSGTLELEVESTSSYDKIVGASTATLDGTLKTTTTGTYALADTLSGVIETTGGISGSFSFLDTQITPTIIWEPDVNGNNLDLVATRDYNNDALNATLTANQKNVAAMMQLELPSATGDLATVKTAIDGLDTNAEVADVYSQVSPEKFAGIPSFSFSNAAMQFNNLQDHMYELRTGEAMGFAFDRGTGAFRGDLSRAKGMLLAYNGDEVERFVREVIREKEEKRSSLFINAKGNFGDQEATDSQPGFHYIAGGITTGLDYRLTEYMIGGFSLGYTRTSSDLGGSGGEIDVDSVSCGIYGTYYGSDFYIDGASIFTSNFYETEREIEFAGLSRKAKADTFGKQLDLSLGAGRDFYFKQLTTGPTATISYSKLWIDSFSESGADSLNLDISEQSAQSLQLGLGWRAEYELKIGEKTALPRLHVSYQHEFFNDIRAIEARLEGGSNIFQATTAKPTRNFALVGCGIAVGLTDSVSFNAGYEAQVGQRDYSAQSVYGNVHFVF